MRSCQPVDIFVQICNLRFFMERDKRVKVMALSGETGADWRTVLKWLEGQEVTPVVDYALRQAAKELAIKVDHTQESTQCSM